MRKPRYAVLGIAGATIVAGILLARGPSTSAEFTIQPIGLDGQGCYAVDLNARGDVLAMPVYGHRGVAAFVQHPNGDIDMLPAHLPALEPRSINDHGDVAGAIPTWITGPAKGFLWRDGKLRWIERKGAWVVAHDVNASGLVAGATESQAFTWKDGRLTLLPDTAGKPAGARVAAVNAAGVMAGAVARPGNHFQAATWSGGSLSLLPSPAGFVETYASGINDRGDVIAYGSPAHGRQHALRWSAGAWRDLGTLGHDARPLGINARGEVVGGSEARRGITFDRGALPYVWRAVHIVWSNHAFLWRNGKMRDLNGLIPRRSGWVLEEANAINDAGRTVGTGTFKGQKRGFLLTPLARP